MLWFTGQNGIYGRVDPDTGKVDVWDAPRGRGPYGIATTPSGQVWYASLAGNHIARIDMESGKATVRSEEHTSELQSLMRISYAVFCLKKQTQPVQSQKKEPHHTT